MQAGKKILETYEVDFIGERVFIAKFIMPSIVLKVQFE